MGGFGSSGGGRRRRGDGGLWPAGSLLRGEGSPAVIG